MKTIKQLTQVQKFSKFEITCTLIIAAFVVASFFVDCKVIV